MIAGRWIFTIVVGLPLLVPILGLCGVFDRWTHDDKE